MRLPAPTNEAPMPNEYASVPGATSHTDQRRLKRLPGTANTEPVPRSNAPCRGSTKGNMMGLTDSRTRIEEIIWCEGQADQLDMEADGLRWTAARLIAEELDTGKTQRVLGEQIGKSHAHVGYMRQVWVRNGNLGGHSASRSFDSYYQEVKHMDKTDADTRTDDVRVKFKKAEELARQGVSFRQIGPAVGLDESYIRRDAGVRQARAEWDEDFDPEPASLTHPERSIACEVEPAHELIDEIAGLIARITGPIYSLSKRDRMELIKVMTTAIEELS